MTSLTGANTYIGVELTSTFGTAAPLSTGDKLEVESITFNDNATELLANPIGSGADMVNETQAGNTSPAAAINCIDMYEGAPAKLTAQFFGTAATPTTWADSAYCHSILYNATRNVKFATVALEGTNSKVYEMPSGVVQKMTVTMQDPKNWVMKSFDVIGDSWDTTSTVNENAALEATTLEDTTRVVIKVTDDFLINAQAGGALAAGDKVNVTSAVIELNHPVEHVREISAASSDGNTEPRSAGSPPLSGTLTVTLRSLADFTFVDAYKNGTEYKAMIDIDSGVAIGTGTYNYQYRYYFPRLKIVSMPDYNLNNAGENPVTIKFNMLKATANPTGMISTYPHIVIVSTKTNSLLTPAA